MAKNTKDVVKTKKGKLRRRPHPIRFIKEIIGELKKLTWPTRKELISYTLAVIAFVAFMAVVIGVLDLLFSQGLSLLSKI